MSVSTSSFRLFNESSRAIACSEYRCASPSANWLTDSSCSRKSAMYSSASLPTSNRVTAWLWNGSSLQCYTERERERIAQTLSDWDRLPIMRKAAREESNTKAALLEVPNSDVEDGLEENDSAMSLDAIDRAFRSSESSSSIWSSSEPKSATRGTADSSLQPTVHLCLFKLKTETNWEGESGTELGELGEGMDEDAEEGDLPLAVWPLLPPMTMPSALQLGCSCTDSMPVIRFLANPNRQNRLIAFFTSCRSMCNMSAICKQCTQFTESFCVASWEKTPIHTHHQKREWGRIGRLNRWILDFCLKKFRTQCDQHSDPVYFLPCPIPLSLIQNHKFSRCMSFGWKYNFAKSEHKPFSLQWKYEYNLARTIFEASTFLSNAIFLI